MPSPTRLKILHILSQRPDSTGSGIYLQAMVREAAARGHDNFVIAGIQSDRDAELDGISQDQCRFVRFNGDDIAYPIPGMTDSMPYPHTRFSDLSTAELATYEAVFTRILTATVAAFNPDIIHSHHLWLVTSLTRHLFPQIPLITSCHGTDLRQFQNCTHLRDQVYSGCNRLDAALALSRAQKRDIETHYGLPPDRVMVVGAGYNDNLFHPGLKPVPGPVQLVYAGKFTRAKGLPWLLNALAKIEHPAWQLHLVGGGSGGQKKECLRLARDLGRRVIVHGQLPQARLAHIFRQSHVFVLSSFFEGLPLVVLEALASGCRVVATDLPGVLEVTRGIGADVISLVRTPRLRNLDQPVAEDLPAFVERLAQAIESQLTAARQQPQIDLASIADRLVAFTWQGKFAQVERTYLDIIERRSEGIGQA
jgi:glycosyltransferase involved in cell wall biosynthesis